MRQCWLQIAVEGCCHGDLDKIYGTLQAMEAKEGRSIDLLICCGDFQVGRMAAEVQPAASNATGGDSTRCLFAAAQPESSHAR